MNPPTPRERADGLVDHFFDDRLSYADEPPGLREAIIDKLAGQIEGISERFGQQVDHLRSSWSDRIPDAYLADEEAAENALQASAAGIRTARALEGIITEPRRFERNLAHRLAPSALWALRSEASRVPRPETRASVLKWSLIPIPWIEDDAQWPPAGAVALSNVRQLTGANGEPIRVHEAPYHGWIQLAMFERQATPAGQQPDTAARELVVATGLETGDEPPPANSMPLSYTPPNPWATPYDRLDRRLDVEQAHATLSATAGALAALVNYRGQPGALGRNRGAGLPSCALVPRIEVIALLGLQPETPALRHVLVDDNGEAIVGRQWRSFLVHDGSYTPLEAAVHGTDLLIRPDLYETLLNAVGTARLTLGMTVHYSQHAPSREAAEDEG